MGFEARMTSKGQMTIPAGIRERLGLQTGDRIAFIETDNGFLILPRNRPASSLFGALAEYSIPDTTLDDYDRAIGEGIGNCLHNDQGKDRAAS